MRATRRSKRELRLSRHRLRKPIAPHLLSKPDDLPPLSRPEHAVRMDYPSILTDFNLSLAVASAVFVALIGFLGIAWTDAKLAPRTITAIQILSPIIPIPVGLLIYRVGSRSIRLLGHQRHRKMHQFVTILSLVILIYSTAVGLGWFFWMMDDLEARFPSNPIPPDLM